MLGARGHDLFNVHEADETLHGNTVALVQSTRVFQNKVERGLSNFNFSVSNLQQELEEETSFLDGYQRMTMSKMTALTHDILFFVRQIMSELFGSYDGLMEYETDLMRKSARALGTDDFEQMAALRDIDLAAQAAIKDDKKYAVDLELASAHEGKEAQLRAVGDLVEAFDDSAETADLMHQWRANEEAQALEDLVDTVARAGCLAVGGRLFEF